MALNSSHAPKPAKRLKQKIKPMIQATTAYPHDNKPAQVLRDEQNMSAFIARLRANVKAEIFTNLQKQKST